MRHVSVLFGLIAVFCCLLLQSLTFKNLKVPRQRCTAGEVVLPVWRNILAAEPAAASPATY
jgi:hypothetical protein